MCSRIESSKETYGIRKHRAFKMTIYLGFDVEEHATSILQEGNINQEVSELQAFRPN